MSRPSSYPLHLALQGGGAHGAFTWGVLDALLADGRARLDAVSGTSAGAINAVVLAQGLMDGGPSGAREALRRFWGAVGTALPFDLATPSADGGRMLIAPPLRLLLQWTQFLSPGQLNPLDLHPLRDILREQVDFERLRRVRPLRLYIAATRASSGRLRLFREHEISLEAVMASTCLPTLHRAVQIDGQAYWDGGYAANPPVAALIEAGGARDLLLVLLTPLEHAGEPETAPEIRQRTLEFAFSAAFLREMALLADMQVRARRRWWDLGEHRRSLAGLRLHLINGGDALAAFGTESKLAAQMGFFETLFSLGSEQAQAWLGSHGGDPGRLPGLDLQATFG